jgi:NAD(P)-dependent dehydrogenase (short-subunit alcohol dehydrogenase family)
MACPPSTTVDGFERQFAVNYLSHFTLTMLLLPTMISSSSPSFNSRVIWVSSTGHRFGAESFDFSTIGHLDTTDNNISNYIPEVAYGHSKLAMIWASNHLDRKYGSRGVHSLALHPGGIVSNLMQYMPADQVAAWMQNEELLRSIKSPEQGAATQVWAAAAPVWEGVRGGLYLNDVTVAKPCPEENINSLQVNGFGPLAYDPEKEERLWKLSLEMAGLEDV